MTARLTCDIGSTENPMTDGNENKREKKRLASAYIWLGLGWGAIGFTLLPMRGDTLTLIVGMLPLAGIIFSFIALLYSTFGIATCGKMRHRFIPPLLLSTPPVAFQIRAFVTW